MQFYRTLSYSLFLYTVLPFWDWAYVQQTSNINFKIPELLWKPWN